MFYKYCPLQLNVGKNILHRDRSEIVWEKGRKNGTRELILNGLFVNLLTSEKISF